MEIKQNKMFSVEDGKVKVEIGAKLDSDQDGKAAIEAGGYLKMDVAELLEEIGKSKDQASLVALSAFIEKFAGQLPKVEKEF